jgi:hypothetical protein
MKRTSTLRRMLGTGLGCVVLGATVVTLAAPAGAADAPGGAGARRHRVHLTAEQRQCLADQGITRPIRPITPQKVQKLKDAAAACDITLPARATATT